MNDLLALVRLLQLASPALPVGAFSYSQGLEWQVDSGIVRDAMTAQEWIGELLEHVQSRGEAAVLARLLEALRNRDAHAFRRWNAWLRASRESAELRAETEQMGGSLLRLLRELELLPPGHEMWRDESVRLTFPAAFALAARLHELDDLAAVSAYLYAWLENQVLAAIKLVPLGQFAGQRMLHALAAAIPAAASRALALPEDDIASFAPGLALASMRHETQHTRLFRS